MHAPPPSPAPADGSGPVVRAWLQPAAPPKPPVGAPCNGCGLCCLAEPCPVGMLLSRRRQGACVALRWQADAQRYACGLLSDPGGTTGLRAPWAQRLLVRLARRWIAAGTGCDAALEATPGAPAAPPPH